MAGRIVGVPAIRSTDVGPIIEAEARENIAAYVAEARAAGRVIAEAQRTDLPSDGHFVPPALIRLDHVTDLKREIFGPVLHVATWKGRSEERRVGKGWVSTCRSRGSPDH